MSAVQNETYRIDGVMLSDGYLASIFGLGIYYPRRKTRAGMLAAGHEGSGSRQSGCAPLSRSILIENER